MTGEEIFVAYRQFMKVWQEDENGRFHSYDHCRNIFIENYYKKERDVDLIALNLYAFLASWGMLRGSSFLLQKDYKFLKPVVEILYEPEFEPLLNYDIAENKLNKQEYISLIIKLGNKLSKYLQGTIYFKIDKVTKIDRKEFIATDKDFSLTLLTKIIMGTLGCTPAIDRFDMATLSLLEDRKRKTYRFNESTFGLIWNVAKEHYAELINARNDVLENFNIDYPIFKILDMCLWQSGR